VLGTGGSQFPVSLIMLEDGSTSIFKQIKQMHNRLDSMIIEEDVEAIEANLFVSSNVIKL
jgi:hypothetical protein